jgi:hypothetical protein
MEESVAYSMSNLAASARPARVGARVDDIDLSTDGFRLCRTHYRLTDIQKFQGVDQLKKLLAAWYASFHDDWLPREIDPWTLKSIGLLGDVHIVDTRGPSSDSWWFRLYGTGSRFYGGRDFTRARISEFNIGTYANATRDDYSSVVHTGFPRFQFLHTMTPLSVSNRYRLILPLSSEGDLVDKLLVAWTYTRVHPFQ